MKDINFEIGFLRDVKKNKYVSIYCRVIDQLDKANFEHEFMLDSIGLLKRHGISRPDHWGNTKYDDTPEIQELHRDRRKRLAVFRDLVDRLTSWEGFISKSSTVALQNWMKSLRKKIGLRNTMEEMLAVHDIEFSAKFYPYLKKAMEEANLMQFADGLIELNDKITHMEDERREFVDTKVLGQKRRLSSYEDLKDVLAVLNVVMKLGDTDAEIAGRVGHSINDMLRRERGYVRMVDTKKKKEEEAKESEPKKEDSQED